MFSCNLRLSSISFLDHKDERWVARFEEQFDAIIEEASLYREELKATIADLCKKQSDETNEYESQLAILKSEEEMQKYEFRNDVLYEDSSGAD